MRITRPAWYFDRADRLAALVDRTREMMTYLQRLRCDVFDQPAVHCHVEVRLRIVESRFRRLAELAHAARRAKRLTASV
jgi:hypothetical protein